MKPVFIVLATALILSGCEPSFKEEYQATLKELEVTRQALVAAQEKLKAADNEIRHKIFTLIRQSNKELQASTPDAGQLGQINRQMQVHIDSYTQLNGNSDHVATTAGFYNEKLSEIRDLLTLSRTTYDRRFNECLATLDSKANSRELGTMLCEVQADVARQDMATQFEALVKSLLFIADKQLQAGRQANSSSASPSDLEAEFQSRLEKVRQQQAG